MKNSWKIKLAAAGCSMLLCTGAAASETLLASTTLQQEQGKATVELWGERLPGGYTEQLLLLLKEDGKLVTAYAPSVKGGYNPVLQAVQVKPLPEGDERQSAVPQQLLLSLGQGDWEAGSEYRIIDFTNPKQIAELFSAADSMGIVTNAYNKEDALEITLQDGQKNNAPLPEGFPESGRVEFGGLFSLTAYDVDGDGQQEVLTSQQLTQRRQLLAEVGAVWRLQQDADKNERWQRSAFTVMTATPVDKGNTINDGCDFDAGCILPRKMVVPGGEATYPVFASKNVELQNKINAYLEKECAEYLQLFYQGQADMAFKVLRADDLLLSLQLISGKDRFIHHQLHLDPATGEPVKLEQILNLSDPDLRPLLQLLCTNKSMDFTEGVPREWYLEGRNLFLVQRICGNDEVAGFALGNLHKFLLDKKWLQQN